MTKRNPEIPQEPPDYLTVDEVAALLRISRNGAYALVRQFVASGGKEGIPAERYGKQFRIPRYAIEERLGGPITWPISGFHPAPAKPEPQPAKRARRARSAAPDDQPQLFIA